MKFIITGSGGCVCTPKPLCQCPVCVQAREKGVPYARCGCSLYIEDIALLVDTPEDIAVALNNADIKAVDSILYSHWDPDHTMGMRIMEQLRLEWLDYYDGIRPAHPINVWAGADVMRDLNGIRSKNGALLDYYEQMGLIRRQTVDRSVTVGPVKITIAPVPVDQAVSVFVFESAGKKLIYAPCDCTPFPDDEVCYNADALILGNTFIGDTFKDGRTMPPEHPLRKELHSFEQALEIKRRYGIGRLVITHIEETWAKTYDDYAALEQEHENVRFAYDGFELRL